MASRWRKMEKRRIERRQHERVLFKYESGINGMFKLPDQGSFKSPIMNLGMGGLQFILSRAQSISLKAGDSLILEEIQGNQELNFLKNVNVRVKWVLNLEYFEHTGIGCVFENIQESIVREISDYIDAHHSKK